MCAVMGEMIFLVRGYHRVLTRANGIGAATSTQSSKSNIVFTNLGRVIGGSACISAWKFIVSII